MSTKEKIQIIIALIGAVAIVLAAIIAGIFELENTRLQYDLYVTPTITLLVPVTPSIQSNGMPSISVRYFTPVPTNSPEPTSTFPPSSENSIKGVVYNVHSPLVLACYKEPRWDSQRVSDYQPNSSLTIVARIRDSSWLLTDKGCWVTSEYVLVVSGNLSDLIVNNYFPTSTPLAK